MAAISGDGWVSLRVAVLICYRGGGLLADTAVPPWSA
jgi:hypothetical protein